MIGFFIHSLKRKSSAVIAVLFSMIFCLNTVLFTASAADIVLTDSTINASNPAISNTQIVGDNDHDIIRVGLYYANDALPTANLQNYIGSGFEFGYFDSEYRFVSLAHTDITAITMAKDSNLYLNGSVYNENGTGSLLGAWHVQLADTYSDYDDAYTASMNYDNAFPAYENGRFVVRIGHYASSADAQNAASDYLGASAVGQSTTCITVCKLTTNDIIFEFDYKEFSNFAVMPVSHGEKAVTWFKGYKYHGGFQYTRAEGNDITIMNFVDIDDYAAGVIAYEMSSSWPLEALKAQALCARSYAVSCNNHKTFDVCPTTSCQVYRGVYSGSNEAVIRQAVEETSGQCIYYNGEVIKAYFHSSDGGATESSYNTWGGERPYLVGKIDPYEKETSNPNANWTYYYTLDDFTSILNKRGYSNNGIAHVEVTEYSASGNVNELTFTTKNGNTIVITGDDTRGIFENSSSGKFFSRHFKIFGPGEAVDASSSAALFVNDGRNSISSGSYSVLTSVGVVQSSGELSVITGSGQISKAETQTDSSTGTVLSQDKYVITGGGWGHNVGMSQYGAKAMAELGKTYDEIIKFYFTGVTIG